MGIFGLILSKNGIRDIIRVYGSEIWQNNLSKIILNMQKRSLEQNQISFYVIRSNYYEWFFVQDPNFTLIRVKR